MFRPKYQFPLAPSSMTRLTCILSYLHLRVPQLSNSSNDTPKHRMKKTVARIEAIQVHRFRFAKPRCTTKRARGGRALSAGAFEPCSNYSNASNFSNNFSCSSVQSRFSPAIGRHPNPGQCLTRFHRARDVRSKRVALNRAAADAAANKCQPHPGT